jgi:CrcB protein
MSFRPRALLPWLLVTLGAVPGALLRWRLEQLAPTISPGLPGLIMGDLLANLLACALLGVVLALPPERRAGHLAGGIGFCGSLSTFSGWISQLQGLVAAGRNGAAASLLLVSLGGGLVLLRLSQRLTGHLMQRGAPGARRP